MVPGDPAASLSYCSVIEAAEVAAPTPGTVSVRGVDSAELEKLTPVGIAQGAPDEVEKAATVVRITIRWSKLRAGNSGRSNAGAAERAEIPGAKNPIDAFLLERLAAKNITFAPEAGRLTSCGERAPILIGLPPSPSEMQDYLADRKPDAYERLIDRLLASPRYGERWARYWLMP